MTTEISAGSDLPNDFNTIIEIPAHVCGVKYEYNKDSGMLEVDRFMTSAMHYPCNYGFIPQTLAEDGDPTDILLVTPFPIQAGCLVRARPIGVLQMEDEAGRDDKILAVPLVKACPQYASWESLDDVPQLLKDQLEHFFNHYKDLDKDKWVKVQGWEDCATAKKSITDAKQRYKNK